MRSTRSPARQCALRRLAPPLRTPRRGRWSMSMSNSSSASPLKDGGGCTGVTRQSQLPTGTRRSRPATTTSSPASMTTPTDLQRSALRREGSDVRLGSTPSDGLVRQPRSAGTATTGRTRWPTGVVPTGAGCVRPGNSNADSSDPAVPGPMARLSASTGPCSQNGAYHRPWTSNTLRQRGLDQFFRRYNTRRGRSTLGGRPPIRRLAD